MHDETQAPPGRDPYSTRLDRGPGEEWCRLACREDTGPHTQPEGPSVRDPKALTVTLLRPVLP